jgi:hypothetical protein
MPITFMAADTLCFIEAGRMITKKFLQDLGLAHAGQTIEQHAWHAIMQWVVEQGIEMREYGVCSGVGNPAIDFDKLNAFLWA